MEKQLTTAPHGHVLTNTGVWSADGQWIVYDTRSDAAGAVFDGTRVEKVHVDTGEVRVLYESRNGACCGVATWSPAAGKVVFILGPENPTPDWRYAPNRRQGVIVDDAAPGAAVNLDARDLMPPFTPGALRGGTHLHVFSGDGRWVSFTYQDQVLERFAEENGEQEMDLRNVGVSVPAGPVRVGRAHPRNHDGEYFSVLVTRTTAHPMPGSDEICRAFEEAWVGVDGYVRADGSRQKRAIAFQGEVVGEDGRRFAEALIVDLPEDVMTAGGGTALPGGVVAGQAPGGSPVPRPLQGTATRRPFPPRGVAQRRLTFTEGRKYPGICGPRHWLRSSPDGSRIALLMKDHSGIVQLWTVSPTGGEPAQITHNRTDIASAFTWSPGGGLIAHVMDRSVCVTEVSTGTTTRLTPRSTEALAPRPEACVFSPNGKRIAYVRRVPPAAGEFNQIFVVSLPD